VAKSPVAGIPCHEGEDGFSESLLADTTNGKEPKKGPK